MRSMLLTSAALVLALTGAAHAVQQPIPGRSDGRIRYVNYDSANVVEIWSTPGAVVVIEFGEGETIDSVAAPDKESLEASPRGNYLFFKFSNCLIPQPVLVLTKTAAGKYRRYAFQVETTPQICDEKRIQEDIKLASTQNRPPIGAGNLKFIATDALAAGKDVSYSVSFRYPGDEAEKRRTRSRAERDRASKDEANNLLRREVDFATHDVWFGNRNYRYWARGDAGLTPRYVFDNGYLTALVFPGLQRMPAVFTVQPDGKEATANYSVRGDTIIVTGTAQIIRVRDGLTVMEIFNLGYNPVGSTPGTGTASPLVERVAKGASDGR